MNPPEPEDYAIGITMILAAVYFIVREDSQLEELEDKCELKRPTVPQVYTVMCIFSDKSHFSVASTMGLLQDRTFWQDNIHAEDASKEHI